MASKNIILNIKGAKKTLDSIDITTGQKEPVHVQALSNVQYELVDKDTQFAPENVTIKRDGDDLLIAFEGSDISQPDLVIEGYYSKSGNNMLVGLNEDGKFYAFVPESAQAGDAVTMLADQIQAGQALGGEPLGVAGQSLWPWALLAAAAALAGAASGGGDSATPVPAPKPDAGTIDAPNDTNDNTPTIKGQDATAGAAVTVVVKDKDGNVVDTLKTTVKPDGSYQVTPSKPIPDGKYTAEATVTKDGQSSQAQDDGSVDTIRPDKVVFEVYDNQAPVVGVVTDGGHTNDTTPTIRGKGEPGATVQVVISGQPDLVVDGIKVDGKGNWSIKDPVLTEGQYTVTITQTDKAGNTSEPVSSTFTVDTTPNSAGRIDAPQLSNDPTPVITGKEATPYTKISVVITDAAGQQQGPIEVVSDGNGNYTVVPKQSLADGDYTVKATPEDDAAGNQGKTVEDKGVVDTIVSAEPKVEITTDGNNDGFINFKEHENPIQVKVSFDKDKSQPGDIITITSTSQADPKEVTLKQADIDNRSILTSFPSPLHGETIKVEAQVRDKAGNTSPVGEDSAKLDLSNLKKVDAGIEVTITEDVNNDGYISADELEGQIDVVVTLPKDTQAGDKLFVQATGNAKQEILLTQPMVDKGKVNLAYDAPASGVKFEVSAQVKDAAGNESDVGYDSATMATALPGAPVISFPQDAEPNGLLNAKELTGDVQVAIKLPNNAKADDVLTVTDNDGNTKDITLTAQQIEAGQVITTLPKPTDGKLEVEAVIVDTVGNTSPKGEAAVVVDTTVFENLAIRIVTDGDNDQFINSAELAATNNKVVVEITVPKGAVDGDTLTITASGNTDKVVTLSGTDISTGTLRVEFNPTGNNTTFKTTASIEDVAGNKAGPVQDSATIQTGAPADPQVKIVQDEDDDGWINIDEFKAPIDVSVTLPAGAQVGDTLVVKDQSGAVQNIVLTLADIQKGSVATTVANPGDGNTVKVSAQLFDQAGNPSKVATDSATLDLTALGKPTLAIPEAADGYVNKGDLADGVQAKITPPAGAEPKNPITITITDEDGKNPQTVTTTVPDGWKEGDAIEVTLPKDKFPADGDYIVKATITDQAGNVSAPSNEVKFNVDTSVSDAKISITAIEDDTGLYKDDFVTSDQTLLVHGELTQALAPDEHIEVSNDQGKTWTKENITLAADGVTWQYDDTGTTHKPGIVVYQARIMDQAGNLVDLDDKKVTVVIDTVKPDQKVTITQIVDDFLPQPDGSTGSVKVADGGKTNDGTPLVKGTLIEPLNTPNAAAGVSQEVVQVFVAVNGNPAVLLGQAEVNGTDWHYQDNSNYADGDQVVYTAKVVDLAGNEGSESGAYTINLDTSQWIDPANGEVSNDIATQYVGDYIATGGQGSAPKDTAKMLVINSSGETIAFGAVDPDLDTPNSGQAGIYVKSGYEYELEAGHTAVLHTIDDVGNISLQSNPILFVGNAGGQRIPDSKTVITSIWDDVGARQGNLISLGDQQTDDSQLSFSGTSTFTNTPSTLYTKDPDLFISENFKVMIYDNGHYIGTAQQTKVDGTNKTFDWSFDYDLAKDPHYVEGSMHEFKAVTVYKSPSGSSVVLRDSYSDSYEVTFSAGKSIEQNKDLVGDKTILSLSDVLGSHQQLTILGDKGDVLNMGLTQGEGWVNVGTAQQGSDAFYVYQHNAGGSIQQVLVQDHIFVI